MAVVVKDMEGNMETLENGFHVVTSGDDYVVTDVFGNILCQYLAADVQEIFSSNHSD